MSWRWPSNVSGASGGWYVYERDEGCLRDVDGDCVDGWDWEGPMRRRLGVADIIVVLLRMRGVDGGFMLLIECRADFFDQFIQSTSKSRRETRSR